MKIDVNNYNGQIVDSIVAGETFRTDNEYYMATDEYDESQELRLCVKLSNGVIYRLSRKDIILPISLKVIKDGD